jgi:hypothetical protein
MNLAKKWGVHALTGILIFFLYSCGATYNEKTADLEHDLVTRNFDGAIASIENNDFLQKKRNRLLYLMEKGKVEHMKGNYESSNQLFEEAYILIDDRIKTNAGQAVAAKLTNPMAAPYKGEDFEKVNIHYYKALNFFQLGKTQEALVEAKRINIKLNELNQRYNKNKNKYTEDAFAQILQGLLYEATGDINNAFIAYRNAADLYLENEGSYFGVSMPYQLKKDLIRTSKALGFTQEFNDYSEKFQISLNEINSSASEAIVFWENGLGPMKDQTVLTVAGGGFVAVDDSEESIFIPIPVGANLGISSLAIPKYKQRESYYSNASINYNGNQESFEMVEDFFPIARQCLRDRMLREVVDMALRLGTKKVASKGLGMLATHFLGDTGGDLVKLGADVAGAATEKADTRNWQTLPATISYVRVPLEEDQKNTFVIKKQSQYETDHDTLHVDYKKGLQLVSYFDVGRATSNYVAPSKLAQNDALVANTTSTGTTAVTNVDPATLDTPEKRYQHSLEVFKEEFKRISGRYPNEKEMEQGRKSLAPLLENNTTPVQNASFSDNSNMEPINNRSGGSIPVNYDNPSETATIYIIRRKKGSGSKELIPVYYNDKFLTELENKSYGKFQATPGKASFTTKDYAGEPWKATKTVDLNVEAGKTYYIVTIFDNEKINAAVFHNWEYKKVEDYIEDYPVSFNKIHTEN